MLLLLSTSSADLCNSLCTFSTSWMNLALRCLCLFRKKISIDWNLTKSHSSDIPCKKKKEPQTPVTPVEAHDRYEIILHDILYFASSEDQLTSYTATNLINLTEFRYNNMCARPVAGHSSSFDRSYLLLSLQLAALYRVVPTKQRLWTI